MRTASKPIAFLASVISIGVLLYSPLCSLSCAASDCSVLPNSKVGKQKGQSSHCQPQQDPEERSTEHHDANGSEGHSTESHHDATSSKGHSTESREESDAPDPHRDSGDCPAHTDAIAILSSEIKAPTVLQQNVQPITAVLSETLYFSFDGFAPKSAGGRPFRSPPKRAVISVYRI
jgi:hypothetical protein